MSSLSTTDPRFVKKTKFYNSGHSTHPNQCKGESASTTYTPLHLPLPTTACRQCNLGCTMQFNYVNPLGWNMSAAYVNVNPTLNNEMATAVKDLPGYKSTSSPSFPVPDNANILRFYPDNSFTPPRQDVVYNNVAYQLEFIEIYSTPLHTFKETATAAETQAAKGLRGAQPTVPAYDVEIVLCHSTGGSSGATPTQWLNVSVFAKQMATFSLSQSFFYDLLTPLYSALGPMFANDSADASDANSQPSGITWDACLSGVTWSEPVVNGGKTPSASSTACSSSAAGSPALPLKLKSYWSPYQVLPSQKSFYTYAGEFPYAPCLYSTEMQSVQWVVLDHGVTINSNDFSHLQTLMRQTAIFNMGGAKYYPPQSLATEDLASIAYNNGKMVSGNTDNDKFYVRCLKKDPVQKQALPSGVVVATQQELDADAELSQIPGTTGDSATLPNTLRTFYTPPSSPISALTFCLVFALFFFAIFAASSWLTESDDPGSRSVSIRRTLIAALCIALVVMYIMSCFLVSASWGLYVLWVALTILFGAGFQWLALNNIADLEFVWNALAYYVWPIVVFIWLLVPVCTSISSTIKQTYQFYYTLDSGSATQFYIGTKANVSVDFAGYNLPYNNAYTVTAPGHLSAVTSGAPSGPNAGVPAVPTNSFLMIPEAVYNPPPSAQANASAALAAAPAAAPAAVPAAVPAAAPSEGASASLPESLFPSPTEYATTKTGESPTGNETPQALSNNSAVTGYTTSSIELVTSGSYVSAFSQQLGNNHSALLTILNAYTVTMKASAADPLNAFVGAYTAYVRQIQGTSTWVQRFVLVNPLAFSPTAVTNLLMNTYPTLYLYLTGSQPTDLPATALAAYQTMVVS